MKQAMDAPQAQPISLERLIRPAELAGLEAALAGIVGAEVRIVSPGSLPRPGIAVSYDLDVVAEIHCHDAQLAASLVPLMQMYLLANARYVLAADLHRQVVDLDYQELERRNDELARSRAGYRALAEQLEQRVRDQVAEIARQQQRLYRAERTRAIGNLAAGVAHEINNPMSFVIHNLKVGQDYGALIRRHLGQTNIDPELQEAALDLGNLMEESLSGALRVSSIVNKLRGFSDLDNDEFRPVDPMLVVSSALDMLHTTHNPACRIHQQMQAGHFTICAHAGHLAQAVFNILENAMLASADQGEISLHDELEGDNYILHIRDTGLGMNAASLTHAFDPFFTTREVGEGAGLGLTLVQDVIQAHDGSVAIDSEPGRGTQVSVTLPGTRRLA